MSNNYVVYVHINKTNGKRYYGITCQKPERRWANGKGYQKGHIKNAIEKYGWDGFDHIIIASGVTEDEAKWLEVEMIAAHNTTDREYGYNLTGGGDGSNGLRGEKSPNYGKPRSEETKRKMSESRKGRFTGENNAFYGKVHSEETKRKMRGKNNGMAKSVICITTKKIFFTVIEGAKFYGINHENNISSCCRGKQKSAGKLPDGTKLVWRYVNYKHNKTYRVA